jgi:hypothetical protein
MALFIVIIVFILLLVSLLLVPITICLDTTSNQYYIELQGLIKADFERHDVEVFRVGLKIFFIKFYIYPLKRKRLNKQKKDKEKGLAKAKKHLSIIKIFKILKTFKVTHFFANIDTGNYVLNAKLYPLFALLNYNNGNFHINFIEINQLVIHIKNRPIYILKSFINS